MAVSLAVSSCLSLPSPVGAQDPSLLERATRLEQEAQASFQQRDWTAGLAKAREAVALREQALGPSHPDIAESLSLLGQLLRITGDYPGAREALERALTIQERAFERAVRVLEAHSPAGLDTADRLTKLGKLLHILGDRGGAGIGVVSPVT